MAQTTQATSDVRLRTPDDHSTGTAQTKRLARIVGTLFVMATVAALTAAAFLGTMLGEADYLARLAANETRVAMAALLELVVAGCVVAIPVFMYPILRRHGEGIARGYFVLRAIEGVALVAMSISLLTLVTLGQEAVTALATEDPSYLAAGTLLQATGDWSGLVGTQLVLGLGALILNYSLFVSRIVPRFVSVWGLIGAPLMAASAIAAIFGLDPNSALSMALVAPLALNEMALAGWLIVKGFGSSMGEVDHGHR